MLQRMITWPEPVGYWTGRNPSSVELTELFGEQTCRWISVAGALLHSYEGRPA